MDSLNISPDRIIVFCISKIFSLNDVSGALFSLFENGGIGGDVDWMIYSWDENSFLDYGIDRFEGYRCEVGVDEGFCSNDVFALCSEIELKNRILRELDVRAVEVGKKIVGILAAS